MEDQQLPPESNQLDNFFNIAFDASTRAQIRQAAVWAKICSLCAFIGYAIALIVTIFGRQGYSAETEGIGVSGSFQTGTFLGSLITTAIGVIINYFLYRFAEATVRGMDTMDSVKTNEGFNNLRIYFRICGILLIIGLSFALLVILFAVIGFGLSR
jgi:hypothetical protein